MKESRLITFYEYAGFVLPDGATSTQLTDGFTLGEVEQLSKLNEKMGKRLFDIGRTEIKAKHTVGSISFGGLQIQILPKLLCEGGQASSILQNLMHMLSYAKQLSVKSHEIASLKTESGSFIEAYIQIFANSLQRLVSRRIPHAYVTQEDNISFKKGKIVFPQHIKFNYRNQARTYCAFDEFTPDNGLNQTLKFVCRLLTQLTTVSETSRTLKRITDQLSEVSDRPVLAEEARRIILSRQEQPYSEVLSMAQMFLDNSRHSMSSGKLASSSILFDMNRLFEEYVYEILRRNRETIGLADIRYQKRTAVITGERKIGDPSFVEQSLMNSYSDIALRFLDGSKLIIDTKYKLLSDPNGHHGISNSDVYQSLAYRLINSTAELATHVLLIFPLHEIAIQKQFQIRGGSHLFSALTLDLHQDLRRTEQALIGSLTNLFEQILRTPEAA